jgi:hypothetical protein
VTAVDVEIKVNFTGMQIERAKEVFGLEADDADEREIRFGEILTGADGRGALPLLERGVILRVRSKKESGEVTLKLRGPDGCVDVPAWTRAVAQVTDEKKIEGDWADHRLVSASLTAKSDKAGRKDFEEGAPAIADLMSEDQKKLGDTLMIALGQVELLPPISARKWKHEHDGDVDAEEWTVGDLHFLEISVLAKADPAGAQRALHQRVVDGGLKLEEEQKPKTTQVLKFLTGAVD